MPPNFDLDKIRFGTDPATFQKAVDLYEKGKVTKFKKTIQAYSATVIGSKPYQVFVEARRHDYGNCTCYLGEQNVLCKHMVALALYAVLQGKPIPEKDKQETGSPVSSKKLGEISKEELTEVKKTITSALAYIKAYNMPSKFWFQHQSSLSQGTRRLSAIVSELPVSKQTASLLVDLLLRLDKKLSSGGVDDSDGTVGDFIQETVGVLENYAKLDPKVVESFKKFKGVETSFDWEEPLVEFLKSKKSRRYEI